MSFRYHQNIKTQTSVWEAALEATGSRAEDFRTLFADEPGDLLFTACGAPYCLGLANTTL